MKMEALADRTKQFALDIVQLEPSLHHSDAARVLASRLLRSGTKVAARIRHASRSRSEHQFLSRLVAVEQALDETMLWLELMDESRMAPAEALAPLREESQQLLTITVNSIRSAKRRT